MNPNFILADTEDFDNSNDEASFGVEDSLHQYTVASELYDSSGALITNGVVATAYNKPDFDARKSSEVAYAGVQMDPGISVLQQFRNTVFPRLKKERIQKSLEWRQEDDLVSGLIDLKVDALIAGFKLNCQPEKNELEDISKGSDSKKTKKEENNIVSTDESIDDDVVDQSEFQVLLSKVARKFDFRGVVRQLADDYFTTESMIFYWKVDPQQVSSMKSSSDSHPILEDGEELIPGLVDITAISPKDVDWDDSFGRDILKVRIPVEIRDKVRDALRDNLGKAEKIEALLRSGIPQKVIDAVEKGDDFYELDREEGDNWIIKTKNRKHHGLADPSMLPVFLSLEIRRNLKEGEFAAAFRMKHFIFHATSGESIESGPMAGLTNNWASKKETENLLDLLKGTNKATLVATNHTVKFAFIFPPVEMFSPEKYIKHEQIIYYWSGVNVVLYTGEGGKYASGYIGIKRLASHISNVRAMCSDIITEFFDHMSIKEGINTPEGCVVVGSYDENSLKEPKQLLEEVKTMFEHGMGDPVTAISELGRNPASIRRSKLASKKDNEQTGVWEKIVTQDEKNENNGEQGRPPNEGTVQSEETRTQRPTTEGE